MLQNKIQVEKRRHLRVRKNLPITIKHNGFDVVTETKNISCAGAYCQVDRYIPPFTKVKTTISLPAATNNQSQYINCQGVVVRVEKENNDLEMLYNIAIYFNEISKANMQKINSFVKNQAIQN